VEDEFFILRQLLRKFADFSEQRAEVSAQPARELRQICLCAK
jgi:hypothetical protein